MSSAPTPRPSFVCGKCGKALVPGQVIASYLGSEFPIELWKCPECGKVLVPKELATGRMLQVEQALEDK
ncbi:MAG: DVU_1557 family redox protein [Acidobacteriaceae bacterium]